MNKADEWRAKARAAAEEEAADLELPSRMVIRARRPGPAAIAGMGRLPMSLTSRATAQGESEAERSAEDMAGFTQFMFELLVHCVVEPRISLNPKAGEIQPRDLPNEDVDFIIAWAMRGEEAARRQAAERADGHRGHRLRMSDAEIDD